MPALPWGLAPFCPLKAPAVPLRPADLAGYLNGQVYVRQSKHVPLDRDAAKAPEKSQASMAPACLSTNVPLVRRHAIARMCARALYCQRQPTRRMFSSRLGSAPAATKRFAEYAF
jgi:hypothetical protein